MSALLMGRCLVAIACATAFCSSQLAMADEAPYDEDDCRSSLSGFFTTPDTLTKVHKVGCGSNEYLQFEDGPKSPIEADYVGSPYTCLDNETGLHQVVLQAHCTGTACTPEYHVYGVNAETKDFEWLFSMSFFDHDWLYQPFVTNAGACLWRGIKQAQEGIDAALAPLVAAHEGDSDPWNMEDGETLALSPRAVPAETVMKALGAISMYSAGDHLSLWVNVTKARHFSQPPEGSGLPEDADIRPPAEDRSAFRVLQVSLHQYVGSKSVLLVEDKLRRTWAAIPDFGAGEEMHVKDDKLYASRMGAYDFEWFELDLREQVAQKLAAPPDWIGSSEEEDCVSACRE